MVAKNHFEMHFAIDVCEEHSFRATNYENCFGVGGGCVGWNMVVKDKGSEIERGKEMGTVRR